MMQHRQEKEPGKHKGRGEYAQDKLVTNKQFIEFI